MTISGGSYKVRVPKHVSKAFTGVIYSHAPDGTLADDIVEGLRQLEANPRIGVPAPNGTWIHTFRILRAPLVLRVVVSYAVLEEQKIVLVLRLSPG